jgi:hypothetical protein
MRLGIRPSSSLSWLLIATLCSVQANAENLESSLAAYYQSAAAHLDPLAQDALDQISGIDRQLLATRAYLRSGSQFASRWSWTQAQIDRYQDSPEQQAAMQELGRIRARFAELNPGYSLGVNTEVRSLDVQLERWNANPFVERTAEELRLAAVRELATGKYPDSPTKASTDRFTTFLKSWSPRNPAPLAAPGLSRHGQARAFDFHVLRKDRIVASTDMAVVKTVWDRQGWTDKLRTAVESASDRFSGPLPAPYEPWHYEYEPREVRTARASANKTSQSDPDCSSR